MLVSGLGALTCEFLYIHCGPGVRGGEEELAAVTGGA
jgi:hypothetical protein